MRYTRCMLQVMWSDMASISVPGSEDPPGERATARSPKRREQRPLIRTRSGPGAWMRANHASSDTRMGERWRASCASLFSGLHTHTQRRNAWLNATPPVWHGAKSLRQAAGPGSDAALTSGSNVLCRKRARGENKRERSTALAGAKRRFALPLGRWPAACIRAFASWWLSSGGSAAATFATKAGVVELLEACFPPP